MKHRDALVRFYADLAGDGRKVGVPFEDPDLHVWMVKQPTGGVRGATLREVEAQIARDVARERKLGNQPNENEAK